MFKIPTILNTKEFLDAPLDYDWNEEASGFYAVDARNDKVEKILNKLDSKAVFGIATALCEWIYWRVSRHIDRPAMYLFKSDLTVTRFLQVSARLNLIQIFFLPNSFSIK